jgi:hypothetical protein
MASNPTPRALNFANKVLDNVFLDAVNAVKAISNKLFEVDIK